MQVTPLNTEDIHNQIIDGLAEKGYAIIDQVLSKHHLIGLLNTLKNNKDDFKKAGIGANELFQVNRSVRGDYIQWIDNESQHAPEMHYLAFVKELMKALNRTLYLGLKDFEMHYAYYPEGTFYKRHADRFNFSSVRMVSLVLYLNESWQQEQGGELMLYPQKGEAFKVEPIFGRLACFLSEMEHEVMLCHQERHSITAWMLNKVKDLTFLD